MSLNSPDAHDAYPYGDDQTGLETQQYVMALSTVDYVEQVLVPEWLRRYKQKARDYRGNHRTLGIRGQFSELWRKVFKLKQAWWEGIPLENEPPREVVIDMIGHLFLALEMLDRPNGPTIACTECGRNHDGPSQVA